MNTPKLLTVCVAGVETDVAARFAGVLEEQRAHLDAHWEPGDHANADLLIIDVDSIYGHMDWLKASVNGRLVASWSGAREPEDTVLRLHKPLIVDELVSLLNRVSTQKFGVPSSADKPQQSSVPPRETVPPHPVKRSGSTHTTAPVGPRRAVDSPSASERPVLVVSTPLLRTVAPAGLRLADLLEADSPLKGYLRLAAAGLPTLLLDPHHRNWHTESTLKTLSVWCARPLSSLEVQSLDEVQFPAATANLPGQPYTRLKWLAHLIDGAGQLEDNLDPNARYKLSRWPRSERDFPKHFRLATLMLKQAATPADIAARSGATAQEVADFINAYHAIGYMESDRPEVLQEDTRHARLFARARKASTI